MNYFKLFLSRKKYQIISLIFVFCVSFSFYQLSKSKENINNYQYIKTIDYNILKSGDLIFRRGQGILGQALFQIDKTTLYSHVGIITMINNRPFVIHASTGENFGEDAIVIREDLETFLKTELTNAIAIYRLKNSNDLIREKVANIADQYVQKKTYFDTEFSLKTQDRLYCTELVWRTYLAFGIDLVDNKFSDVPILPGQEKYLLPSDLLKSHYLEQIYQLKIKEN